MSTSELPSLAQDGDGKLVLGANSFSIIGILHATSVRQCRDRASISLAWLSIATGRDRDILDRYTSEWFRLVYSDPLTHFK